MEFLSFKKLIWKTHEEYTSVVGKDGNEQKSKSSHSPSQGSSSGGGGGEGGGGADGAVETGAASGDHSLATPTDHGENGEALLNTSPTARSARSRFVISSSMIGDPFEKTKVFGVSLDLAAARNKLNPLVPLPLQLAFEYFETAKIGNCSALEEEGLYRVPGSHQVIYANPFLTISCLPFYLSFYPSIYSLVERQLCSLSLTFLSMDLSECI